MIPAATVRDLQKNYGAKALALAIFVSLLFLALGYKAICRGLVLGAFFSTINFVLMAQTLHKTIKSDNVKASISAFGNICFRYIFIAIPLVIAIKFARFNLAATIVGLFMVQSVILGDHLYRNFFFSGEGEKGTLNGRIR
ncbi:hypothetical protein DSCO28_43150 [Desulfosarcina ovata subsp. sediminis]|uniref:ATP synthase subunit I n=1 Tax=Desulfosarcina ovata subsp. sediminis TaxID=885957 RepID=A0A5K7ZU48_9BACT|nr:ATP synthase subunit I [Desulfosarcina ovata]BBO83749.1 hypothetical protein DSCO28_43150 [Desulfosarcina ovata subsp. sediminis]